jgi:hypothetical protein
MAPNVFAVDVRDHSLGEAMQQLGMKEGFDVALEMSGSPKAFNDLLPNMFHGGKIALLGIMPSSAAIDWNVVVFNQLTIKGIYGREMYETWYKMTAMIQSGLDISPVITHHFEYTKFKEAIELMKLQDGVRLHEQVKVELETFARETSNIIVKPFVLVIARDTTHAKQLTDLIQSDVFFEGRYKTKVIQVDSSKTGAEEDEMVERLLKVEQADEPTEIVIHVNMLKEGWDVTNLYTIIPLRAAHARTLIEQSIGRGLRLPYGKRTGVNSVDRLNIIAHDKFQEIVDEAQKPDSAIRLQQVILQPEQLGEKTVTVVSQSQLASKLGLQPEQATASTRLGVIWGASPQVSRPRRRFRVNRAGSSCCSDSVSLTPARGILGVFPHFSEVFAFSAAFVSGYFSTISFRLLR